MSVHDYIDSNGNFSFSSLACNNINCNKINGTAVGGGGSDVPNLQQVLTSGSNAGDLSITNLNNLT